MTRYLYGGDVELRAGVKSPRLAQADPYRVSLTEPADPTNPLSAGITITTDVRSSSGAVLPAGQVVDEQSQVWLRAPDGHTGRVWISVAMGPWAPLDPVHPTGPRFTLRTVTRGDGALPAAADTGQTLQTLSTAAAVSGGVVKLAGPGTVSYDLPAAPLPGNVIRLGCRVQFDNGLAGNNSATYGVFSTPTLAAPALQASVHVAITTTAWIYQVIPSGSGSITTVSAVSWTADNSRLYEVWTWLDPVAGVALSRLPDGRMVRSAHASIAADCRYPFWETTWSSGAEARPGWADPWADDQRSGWEAGSR